MNASIQAMNWPDLESVIDFFPAIVPPEARLIDVIALMGQAHRHSGSLAHPKNVNLAQGSSCVLVVSKFQLIGIITGQDALKFAAARVDLSEIKALEAMTQPVVTLVQAPAQTALSAWSLLRRHRICHLPIVNEQDEVVGLVTQNDLLQWVDPLECSRAASKPQNISDLQSTLHESQIHDLELLKDQRRLEAFFSQSPDGFFFMMLDRPIQWDDTVDQETVLDYVFSHQRVTKVNAAMLAQYNGTEDEFIGLTPQDFFAHDVEMGRQLWREMFDKGRLHVETSERKLDGTLMWIEGDYSCLYNSDGEIIGHFGIQRDISHRKRAEEELYQSQQDLTDFVENAIVCLHWVSADGTIIWANRAELDLLGYTREEYIGHSITEFHANQTAIEDILERLLSDQPVQGYETDLRCKDGSIRHVLIDSNSSWRDGKFLRTRCFTRDITDRKCAEEALQQSEQKFRAIFDGTFQFIGLLTPEGIVIEANRPALDAIAAKPEDVVGQPFWATPWWTHSPAFQEQLKQGIARAASGELVRFEAEHILANGTSVSVDFSLKPVFDNEGNVIMLIPEGRDISDRKQTEIELRNQKQDLARSNDELQQFAYVASHDLQEPLRMITSYLELLERRYKGQLDERADKFIDYAVDGATRMQTLINDLLSYSRVGTKAQDWECVACAKILRNVLGNLQVAITQSNAIITHDPLPHVKADPSQLTQLFQNLISNAIKFKREETVEIRIEVKGTDGKWLFSIHDNGMGIDTQYLDRIFIIFQRLHSRTEYPGTGIGLAVCKKIVERHGGNLWVESQLGHGSTFYFTLPQSAGDLS